jgi:hypothetical protein
VQAGDRYWQVTIAMQGGGVMLTGVQSPAAAHARLLALWRYAGVGHGQTRFGEWLGRVRRVTAQEIPPPGSRQGPGDL